MIFFILVYDSTHKRIYQSTDSLVKVPPKIYFNKILINSECRFTNNGKKVPQEQRDQLFVPFFRVKNVDIEMGYGLGLVIVLRIVQAHEAAIIYKVFNTGKNCFTITLQKQKPVE